MQTPEDAYSFLRPIGYSTSRCGYCKKTGHGYSYYVSTTSLRPDLYQTLVDRCWRRSGNLLYRPNQRSACCPHYTLRLDSTQFRLSKDQRQAVNRFNRFITGDAYTKEAARRFPRSRQEAKRRDTEFSLVERIHESESNTLHRDLQPDHRLEVTLEKDSFTEEKYAVFKNYQRIVHKEGPSEITRPGFRRFLCESPIVRDSVTDDTGKKRALGSFHQCYRIDGKLVAVGVLDLLPHAVSAVYFFYDESIHQLSPGKLSALREIALAMEGGYQYWYAGYYIHSSPKMRYKMDYRPQYVLDPESLEWDKVDKEVLALFDRQPYVSLSRIRREAEANGDHPASSTVDNALGEGSADGDEHMLEDQADTLFASEMPGILSAAEMEAVDLEHAKFKCDVVPDVLEAKNLVAWDKGSIESGSGIKALFAEVFATMGPDLMPQVCIDLRRPSYQ